MNTDINILQPLVLNIGKVHCHTEWNYKNVCSPFTRIYYITKGAAQIGLPDGIHDLRPHHLYVIPAFTPHDCICKTDFEHIYVHIYNESDHDFLEDWLMPTEIPAENTLGLFERLLELCPNLNLTQTDPQIYDNMSNLYENVQKNKQRDLGARIESRGILYQILATFMSKSRPKYTIQDQRIERIVNYVRTHINEKIDIEHLAEFSHTSKDHLIRIFKKEMKTTPLCYVNKKKIERAQVRLATEATLIKEIAFQLGFEDQGYFNRIFKKFTGTTPNMYRKNINRATP